jgi:uncharacterized RDD family membrane protein YckC
MHDDEFVLETPEHARIEFELAGVGSRFLAGFVDSFIQTGILAAIAITVGWLRWRMTGDLGRMSTTAIVAIISAMLLVIAYYMVFELLWGGQSPGKRLAGLVVVREDGGPIGLQESAVRNVLRLVDMLPAVYTLGMIFIFLTRRCQRLGDMAAGTLVVKVRQWQPQGLQEPLPAPDAPISLPDDPLVARARLHVGSLTPRERDTVQRFVERREELAVATRRELAARIAAGLWPKFPALQPQDVPDPEVFLEVIHRALL